MLAMKTNPTFDIENETGFELVAGVDEAGRGPLCGPVVAAAFIFPNRNIEIPVVIRDSKQMTAHMRAIAYEWIIKNTIWSVAQCSASEIDELNILCASLTAMTRAVQKISCTPQFCLIDGNKMPPLLTGAPVIHGDAKSLSIAAASIIAKETRDKIMHELAQQYPMYGWDKNSGYPTAEHLHAIDKYGINEHYRKTYKPVKERINKNETTHN